MPRTNSLKGVIRFSTMENHIAKISDYGMVFLNMIKVINGSVHEPNFFHYKVRFKCGHVSFSCFASIKSNKNGLCGKCKHRKAIKERIEKTFKKYMEKEEVYRSHMSDERTDIKYMLSIVNKKTKQKGVCIKFSCICGRQSIRRCSALDEFIKRKNNKKITCYKCRTYQQHYGPEYGVVKSLIKKIESETEK